MLIGIVVADAATATVVVVATFPVANADVIKVYLMN